MANQVWVTPILHPAHIARGRWPLEEAQEGYLRRTVETVKGSQEPPVWDISQPPKGSWLYPSLEHLAAWQQELAEAGHDAICYDLETAGDFIICVGMVGVTLATNQIGRALCLRFRLKGGKRYWNSYGFHTRAVAWLASLLDDPNLGNIFHNGTSFDVPLLYKHGFRVRGPILDTMVLYNRAFPESPKGLQFLATKYLWAPVWKTLTDVGDEMEGKA